MHKLTDTATLSGPALREKELQIFRQRVLKYKLNQMAANRGLVNKFTLKDI